MLQRWPVLAEYLEQACSTIALVRPRAIVSTHLPALDHQAALRSAARRARVPLIVVPHSGYPAFDAVEADGDGLIAWSSEFVDKWVRTGHSKRSTRVVGYPESVFFGLYPSLDASPAPRTLSKTSAAVPEFNSFLNFFTARELLA